MVKEEASIMGVKLDLKKTYSEMIHVIILSFVYGIFVDIYHGKLDLS